VVLGGATRQASELAALRHLEARIRAERVGVVLLHDGARPLVSPELVAAVLRTAERDGGAVPGLPALDLGLADIDGPDRDAVDTDGAGPGLRGPAPDGLVAVQTPQGFRAAPLLAAYLAAERCGFAGTDTASCVQRFAPELPIRAIPGDERNIKITYPHDMMIAERLLTRI
jgi:2-C-methyl-D-erythritol 4-phosphate cytidylyltransferase